MGQEILMLSSSYGACFQPCTHHTQNPLVICANRADGLFKNLHVNQDGSLSLSANASAWDQKIYQLTHGKNNKKLSNYSCIVFNIYLPLDLPLLLQNNFYSDANCLKSLSKSQLKDILNRSTKLQNSLILHKNWIRKLNIKKHFSGTLLFLTNPYSSSLKHAAKINNASITKAVEQLQWWTQEHILIKHGIKLILPRPSLFENGLYIRPEYCNPDKYRDWKTLHQSKPLKKDRIHKNQKYGEILYNQILDYLNTSGE